MIWRADVNRFTVLIGPAPTHFEGARLIELASMPALSVIEQGDDGTHAVLGQRETITHLRIEPDAQRWGSIMLPLEPHQRTRARAAQWLLTRLGGETREPSPEALWDTLTRRSHLHILLRLLDGTRAGIPLRELAAHLVDPDIRAMSAAAWVDSAERKRLRRWLAEAMRLVDGQYRNLLGGP
ncbi:hypothetical protein EBBID32_10430 [Sphingobium indicum BiD32]|uniref:T6SS Transcription factor RovC-like DNA binding domain-containing protein n=1 Tax=Sphingobium indicum BiD32 TaxID=1301087 RepID=N1MHN2_9SPHN|nr:DUF2285 domain-containing protein [Sphingobium xenophagum]CCW16705.1 hypothetical protein EBBID32_10430 [Sphingobium indicum BiD32]